MRRLTKIEISFLRWLRDQGGNCALSENDECAKYYRLVKIGYVEMQLPDRFNPTIVNFNLTESGQGILEVTESQRSSVAAGIQKAAADSPRLPDKSAQPSPRTSAMRTRK